MSYSIYVTDSDDEGCNYLVDEHLGSGSSISIYWNNMGGDLPIIGSMLGSASSEDGFILELGQLDEFEKELTQLEKIWREDGLTSSNEDLLCSLIERKNGFIKAITAAKKYNRPVEVW